QFRAGNTVTRLKLRITIPPGLFAVGIEKIRESRIEVTCNMPNDGGNGVATSRATFAQFVVPKLAKSALRQALVSAPLAYFGTTNWAKVALLVATPLPPSFG